MTEAFIPALISGSLAIITALIGKQLVSDPLRNVKAKLDAVNDLPDSPGKQIYKTGSKRLLSGL